MRPDPTARPTFSKLVPELMSLLEAANTGAIQVREGVAHVALADPRSRGPNSGSCRRRFC